MKAIKKNESIFRVLTPDKIKLHHMKLLGFQIRWDLIPAQDFSRLSDWDVKRGLYHD